MTRTIYRAVFLLGLITDLSAKERIRVRGDDGQERIMPENERQRRISEAQKGIVDNCEASA